MSPFSCKERMREYQKKYNQTHREYINERARKYRQTHLEQVREKDKKYYQAHKEQKLEYDKKYCQTHREQRRETQKKHRKSHSEHQREYTRQHVLGTTLNGKQVSIHGLNKRPYTNYCEICGILKTRSLRYHHWSNENPSLGIWVCFKCHGLVEAIDRHGDNLQKIIGRYLKLKETLPNFFCRRKA